MSSHREDEKKGCSDERQTADEKATAHADDNKNYVEADSRPEPMDLINQTDPFQLTGFHEPLTEQSELDLPAYNMNHAKRGIALIFNHEKFDPSTGMGRRNGTENDVKNLKECLGKLEFEIIVYQDLTASRVQEVVSAVSKCDHSDSDCFLCAFLTHGDVGVIYGYDGTIEIQDLFDNFRGENCATLVGKPKIFLIQACRGTQTEDGFIEADGGMETALDSRATMNTSITSGYTPSIPAGADFILSYSVIDGFFSHRNTSYGSWYIQALCTALEAHGKTKEFTEILALVNHLVAQRTVERCADPRMIGTKQMPCFVSMLTKQLIFTAKK